MTLLFSLNLGLSSIAMVAAEEAPPIRIVMSAAFVSESGMGVYDDIAHYLEVKLGRKVEFYSGFSYDTINRMLAQGLADIGFICGLPYVLAHDQPQPQVELLAAPIMKGELYHDKPVYYSYIIVRKDSAFQKFSDLRGKRFIFNDEISNSGYNMPRAFMIRRGDTNGFFGQVQRSGSHEESIRMVALGQADASAVDSLVYDYDLINHPIYVQQTRIIKTLGPAGIPPVVVSSKMKPALRSRLRALLTDMDDNPEGRRILDKALLSRFDTVTDSDYDDIRAMNNLAHTSGFMTIK